MFSPPPTRRRAWFAALWLTLLAAGLLAGAWSLGRYLDGGPQPSPATVTSATGLDFPAGTDVVDADLAEMAPPEPGDRAEITVDVPADAFGDFLDANDMEPPLLTGTTAAGYASGIIPGGCGEEACYSATIIVTDDEVTVYLTVTLL